MRRRVFAISDHVITSLGSSTQENFEALLSGKRGIKKTSVTLNDNPYLCLSSLDACLIDQRWTATSTDILYTRFERLAIIAITEALKGSGIDITSQETVMILSSTKGNIELIDPNAFHAFSPDRVYLWKSAQMIGAHFGNPNPLIVHSHACISGVSALIVAQRYLAEGVYKHAVVCGVDVLSDFILAGFNSLKALSPEPCKPYDKDHVGLNLGEGAGAMVLTVEEPVTYPGVVEIKSGAVSNDANHISGPSRTGEGLFRAVCQAMGEHSKEELAFINAHGTATIFNDDMESIAFSRAGLSEIPLNGLKGYIGHTLGAAGVIETALSACALRRNILPATAGYKELGTPEPITVSDQALPLEKRLCLKTASGFGGCNAAILLELY